MYRNKKRYAGLMWTEIDKYDKMDTKGLETVRRDNCALVRDVIQTSLDKILIHQDVSGAIEYVKKQISDLGVERTSSLDDVGKAILMYAFKYSEFPAEVQSMLAASTAKGTSFKAPKAEKAASDKTPLIVGTFKLADFGFDMPKNAKGDLMSTESEFTWDLNHRYGGRGWEQAFISAMLKEDVAKAEANFTPEFKAWLDETVTNDRGRYAKKPVFNNKSDFYSKFGVEIDVMTGEPQTAPAKKAAAKKTAKA